eukprot:scaffold6421_cov139-Amphora_coffeaeformis.AAC.1
MGCTHTERAHQCCRQGGGLQGRRGKESEGRRADGGVAVVNGVDVDVDVDEKRVVGRGGLGESNREGAKGDGRVMQGGRDTKGSK